MAHKRENLYTEYDDAALASLVKSGNDEAFEVMTGRYMKLISAVAAQFRYSCDTYDSSDLTQEGLVGLFSACAAFDDKKGMSFKNFLMLCVKNRFLTISKKSHRKGSVPSESIVSIENSDEDILDSTVLTVAEQIESREYIGSIYEKIKTNLSKLEQKVILLYLSGCGYKETAKSLNITPKAVDNALYRIRKKLTK